LNRREPAAGLLQAGGVGFGCARVAGEVFVRAELGRIDEDAGDHAVGVLPGQRDQRVVTCMQVAHGRDQRDAQALALPAVDDGAQTGQFGDGFDHEA